ncbi:cysteine-rich CWC family protein [Colwellia echini]|uniref:Cysteine-rich CWC family protein n=1 Tax=Colwellia echini TaxID=1982103 RepID=A0ABY3MZ98_9GAMM|nr:cysteine-rich CWC family protein [Colwellia echini]TYK66555.1 cysteine-rich CWC family protein [Colwellia echini]
MKETSTTNKIDDSICPLCQQSNRCDVNASAGCWCMNTNVPQALLATIPTDLQGKSCVCNNCIQAYFKNKNIKQQSQAQQ